MMEDLPTNMTLYVTPTELGQTNVSYNGEMYAYYPTDEVMEEIKGLHEVFETPESFLTSKLAKYLRGMSDEFGINITVYLYDKDDIDIAWFEFWPDAEIEWDSY